MNKLKVLQTAKQTIDTLKDIKKCPACSYYLSLIQNHAKIGHPIDKNAIEEVSTQ